MLRRLGADEGVHPGASIRATCDPASSRRRGRFVSGADPLALVVSLNVKRRNLTASQRAVAAAEAGVNLDTGTSRESRKQLARLFDVSVGYIANARALVTRAPDLAESVKAGNRPLAGR